MPYSLRDRALFAVLASDDTQMQSLLAAFEAIAHDPIAAAHSTALASHGRVVHMAFAGDFRIYYSVNDYGYVTVTEILKRHA